MSWNDIQINITHFPKQPCLRDTSFIYMNPKKGHANNQYKTRKIGKNQQKSAGISLLDIKNNINCYGFNQKLWQ